MERKPVRYVLKKYVMAISALDAIRKDKGKSVDEVSIEREYLIIEPDEEEPT